MNTMTSAGFEMQNPTRNGPLSLLPIYSFWAWVNIFFGIVAACLLTFLPLKNGYLLYASSVFSFFLATLMGSTLREQMGCAMTCFLPEFMTGCRFNLVIIGLAAIPVISLLVFVSPQVSGFGAVQAYVINLSFGLTLYFVLLRVFLMMENSNWLMFSTPVIWLLVSVKGEHLSVISSYLNQLFWLLPIPAFFAWRSFSKAMAVPDIQRRTLEIPYSDPSLSGSESVEDLEYRRQAWQDRKKQDKEKVRKITTLRLPFSAGIFRYLEIVIARSLLMATKAEFWVMVFLTGVLKPLLGEQAAQMMAIIYPAVFMLYLLNALPVSENSPFLPVSRSHKMFGVLLVNLFILLVFIGFIGFTNIISGLVSGGSFQSVFNEWSHYCLSFVLTAPLYLIFVLVLGLTRNFQIGLFVLFWTIGIMCWIFCINFLISVPFDQSQAYILFVMSGAAWLVYLLFLWIRCNRMSFNMR